MKIPRPQRGARNQGFTLIELLVVISIIAILAGLALPVFSTVRRRGYLAESISNASQIGKLLHLYANDNNGSFPLYKDVDDPSTKIQNANDAFEALMPKYLKEKKILGNPRSAWCKGVSQIASADNQYKVLRGQCDWSYVVGLSNISDTRWPVVATAFSEAGAGTYVSEQTKKGGVWDGEDAIVVYVDSSARQEPLKKGSGGTSFVKRPDQPSANAFVKEEGTWLSGEDVQVLNPMP